MTGLRKVLVYFLDDMKYDVSNARSTLTHDGKWGNADQKLFPGKREEEDCQVRQNSNRDGGRGA
jgi:hypothetical protein